MPCNVSRRPPARKAPNEAKREFRLLRGQGLEDTVPTTTKAAEQLAGYTIRKYDGTRFWEVLDPAGELVCLTVYRRGAREVV